MFKVGSSHSANAVSDSYPHGYDEGGPYPRLSVDRWGLPDNAKRQPFSPWLLVNLLVNGGQVLLSINSPICSKEAAG